MKIQIRIIISISVLAGNFLPISTENLVSLACMGFLIQMIISGSLMILCYVGLIFLYYTFSQILQNM